MRVLCCLDGSNTQAIQETVISFLRDTDRFIGLLYVIDSGPRGNMLRTQERLLRRRGVPDSVNERMREAETMTAQDVLQEGLRYFPTAQTLQREGHPEREIVTYAAEWNADLIVLCPRSPEHGGPSIGPKSVGHTARFVLDHAPCPVLLARPFVRSTFHLPPPPPEPKR
jgi:nucleotide-binding universal stress UspA family protein